MDEKISRKSNGLREFFGHLEGRHGLHVLDLGPASQSSVSLLTGLGHRVYQEDIYADFSGQAPPGALLDHCLNYRANLFDAVLCWDLFDVLPDPAVATPLAARLCEITRSNAALLLFFHTAEPSTPVTAYRTQIGAFDTLDLYARGEYRLQRPYNNRNIENLFRDFHGLKFFLAKDGLREVLVVR